MRSEIKNFDREELFYKFNEKSNPFIFVTTEIEVTPLYNLCKKLRNHYATIGYYVTKAVNETEAFKYRYEDGKFYKYDKLNPRFTQMTKDKNNIGTFEVNMSNDYQNFIKEYKKTEQKFLENKITTPYNDKGKILFSCEPWFNFTSLTIPFDKEDTVPEIVWDKFRFREEKCYLHFMITVHHGFVDGYHIGEFLNTFKGIINNIEAE